VRRLHLLVSQRLVDGGQLGCLREKGLLSMASRTESQPVLPSRSKLRPYPGMAGRDSAGEHRGKELSHEEGNEDTRAFVDAP